MDASKKVRMLLAASGKTPTALARDLGMSQSNVSKKLKQNSFSVKDMERIAEACDAEFEGFFVMENGEKI